MTASGDPGGADWKDWLDLMYHPKGQDHAAAVPGDWIRTYRWVGGQRCQERRAELIARWNRSCRDTPPLAGSLLAAPLWAADVPDPRLTPGAVRPGLTKAKICSIKWGKDERHVRAAMKKQVFTSYGYSGNDDRNAYRQATSVRDRPSHQPRTGVPTKSPTYGRRLRTSLNAVIKDKLENRLNKEMCAGQITLREAGRC